jgi:phenylpropionate dioxygenase-like ring-hydroxylating dioxygenase large terminal subunit
VASAVRISHTDYVDPARYAEEVERRLRAQWLPVCRVDDVARPGDWRALVLAERPVIVTRDRAGALHVLGNVCQHRGSLLVDDGSGNDSALVCPYHRWAYRLDGTLVGGPLTDGADLSDVCLPRVRHIVWEGFVLVNLSGDSPDPTEALSPLSAEIAPWSWSELVTVGSRTFPSHWNWKVMVENWIECYHHIGAHRTTVEPYQPARTTKLIESDAQPWVAMTVDTVEGLEGEPESWIRGVTPQRSRDLSVWAVFPLLLAGSNSRYAFWLHVVPGDVDHHTVTWNLLVHPDQREQFPPERVERELETLSAVHAEDSLACRRVQVGIASGMIDEFRLVDLEAPIASFHHWLASR